MEGNEKTSTSNQGLGDCIAQRRMKNDIDPGECQLLYQRTQDSLGVKPRQIHVTFDEQIEQLLHRDISGAVDELCEAAEDEQWKEARSVVSVLQNETTPDAIPNVQISSSREHTVANVTVERQNESTSDTKITHTNGNMSSSYLEKEESSDRDTSGETSNKIQTVSAAKGGVSNSMATRIEDLNKQGKLALATGNMLAAKRTGLQIMIAASLAMDEFLQGDSTNVTEPQLAYWFQTSFLLLHQAQAVIPVIRCFYTGIIFDINWPLDIHQMLSHNLWKPLFDQITFDQITRSDRQKIFELLDKVSSIAKLARTRGQTELASVIYNDLVMAQNQMFFIYCRCLGEKEMNELTKQMIPRTRRDVLCVAECLYEMGNYTQVKCICANVLTELSGYDCVEAFELWGRTLFQEKEFDIAEKKINQALKNTKTGNENEARLKQLLQEISEKREAEAKHDADSIDQSWLRDTAAEETAKKSRLEEASGETKKKKKNMKKKQYERWHDPPKRTHLTHTESWNTEKTVETPTRVNKIENRKEPMKCRPNLDSKLDKRQDVSVMKDITSLTRAYVCDWSDSEDDSEDATLLSSSSELKYGLEKEVVEDGYEEETNFYERSWKMYRVKGASECEMLDKTLIQSGLDLNMSFMHRFEDKHNEEYKYPPFYEVFFNKDSLRERMIKQPNKFIRCKFFIEGSHVSYCTPIDSMSNIDIIEISGRTKAGQAFNDDEVVVQLLDDEHHETNKRYGKVIGIWERNHFKDIKHPVFLCTLDDKESHLVRPMCKTVPKIHILTDEIKRSCQKHKKNRVEVYTYDKIHATLSDPKVHVINSSDLNKYVFLVAFISWRRQFIYPTGAIIKILPYGDSLQSGLNLLDLKHDVPNLYQNATVHRTEGVRKRYDGGLQSDLADRDDLTNLKVFTIDPHGAKDLDDALSLEVLEDGYKVGIHIADVSHFVQKGDPIDQEAAKRTTTFYPGIDGKLPRHMIPEPLSTNLFSLLPGETRLTLSVFIYLNRDGTQTSNIPVEIKKTFIKSCEQFTYRKVQDIIEKKTSHFLKDDIHVLIQLATSIRKVRLRRSMYALDIGNEENNTDDSVWETFQAHYLVEEFMIMANKEVAKKLLRIYPGCTPLRCQQPPAKESMATFLKQHGSYVDLLVKFQDKKLCDYKTPSVDFHLGTKKLHALSEVIVPNHIWDIISSSTKTVPSIVLTDDFYPLQHLVQQHWIKIQERAEYKCSNGRKDMPSTRHYSLQLYPYTHFTSPIRRYNDLVVHRLLHAFLKKSESPYNKTEVEAICSHDNSVIKRAKKYQNECRILKQAIDLRRKPKMMTCYIDEVSDHHITLSSPDLMCVSNVHKELSFNLLGVCSKPVQGTNTSVCTEFVTVTWRKRLYDSKGLPPQLLPRNISRDDKNILNAYKGSVFIPVQKWARILKCAVEGRYHDMKRAIKNTKCSISSKGLDDISTENLDPRLMQPYTKFCMTFKPGQSVRVQIAASPWCGVLTPRPVLFDMTNNVKFCLQHTDDPVLHLSNYSTNSTCDQYTSTKMYLERWLPLLDMEAAINAVTNEESCIINNVPVKYESNIEGKITLPVEFCRARNIEFSGTNSEVEYDETFDENAQSYDWLCLKFILPIPDTLGGLQKITTDHSPIWIGHASVTSVTKKISNKGKSDGKIIVRFRLHKHSAVFPRESNNMDRKFSIEILRKSEVDRRTESFLKQMPSMQTTLSHTVALNKGKIPPLDRDHVKMAEVIDRDLYMPLTEDIRLIPKNNDKQQEAINKALNNRFTLIQGPPGTGKTFTGIKLLYLFNKINGMLAREGGPKHQVLFCGPSNKSVDVVAKMLLKRLGSLCPKFVRVYGRSIEASEFPIPGRTFLSKSTAQQKADPKLKNVTLHYLIRQKGKLNAEKIVAFDQQFRSNGYGPQPSKDIKEYVRLIREASINEIRKHDVIICTTAVGSNTKVLKAASVFQVIIDEAGMCTEPQCMVPIIATKAEQVVLIGDHKQLRPIIKSKLAAELGLDKSLFQRYAESNTARNVKFTMLNLQYRMNPEICRFPSDQFYNSQLDTGGGLWMKGTMNIWPSRHGVVYPHVFISVEGHERTLTVMTEEGNEQSRSNLEEIDIVAKVYKYFIDHGIHYNDINVISQYNAQCTELRRTLEKERFRNYNVTTVVSSQGGEWDYVIFSTVRSLPDYKIEKHPTKGWCKQNLGFITDENQINVALTRARKGLVIVGNPNLLRCDNVWNNLISEYEQCGCIFMDGEFPPQHRTKRQPKNGGQGRK